MLKFHHVRGFPYVDSVGGKELPQGKFWCDRWYQNKLLRSIEKVSKAFGEGKKVSKENTLNKLTPSIVVVVEPKAKKRYKTKKEKKKNTTIEELIALRQTMVGEHLCDEKVQNIKEMVEEVAKAPPCNSKKMIKGKDSFPHRSKEGRN
jgi:hypothetical protein